MSDQETENIEPEVEATTEERPTLFRTFDVGLEPGDGRTVEGLCVPYNVAATVADPPDFQPYEEMFVRGAFKGAAKAPNRVWLAFEHNMTGIPSIGPVLGHGVEFEERDDGLYGNFRVLEHTDGDKALTLIREKVLPAMSIEFEPLGKPRIVDGIVQRTKVHLDRVALVRQGAYPQAQVLAVRAAAAREELGKYEREQVDQKLVDRLARFINIPTELVRAFTEQAWDGSAGRWPDAASYCRSCLIDDNPAGQEKSKALCHLPIREPGGDININAVRNALARVNQVQTSTEKKARARRRLEALLAQFNNQ